MGKAPHLAVLLEILEPLELESGVDGMEDDDAGPVWERVDTLHVQHIQLHGQSKEKSATQGKVIAMTENPGTGKDDLPF